jgi:hypothetical protein
MRRKQKHENLQLITAIVITRQGILKLTTDGNLIAVDIYVAYRKPFPDEKTVKIVKEKLKQNNIEYNQLVDWPMTNCQ